MSFNVVSLFTNVSLKKAVDIILKRICSETLLQTTLSKWSLEKTTFRHTCKSTVITKYMDILIQLVWEGVWYIIMIEMEKVMARKVFKSNIFKFYVRFLNDTLELMKCKDTKIVLKRFTNFDNSL